MGGGGTFGRCLICKIYLSIYLEKEDEDSKGVGSLFIYLFFICQRGLLKVKDKILRGVMRAFSKILLSHATK